LVKKAFLFSSNLFNFISSGYTLIIKSGLSILNLSSRLLSSIYFLTFFSNSGFRFKFLFIIVVFFIFFLFYIFFIFYIYFSFLFCFYPIFYQIYIFTVHQLQLIL